MVRISKTFLPGRFARYESIPLQRPHRTKISRISHPVISSSHPTPNGPFQQRPAHLRHCLRPNCQRRRPHVGPPHDGSPRTSRLRPIILWTGSNCKSSCRRSFRRTRIFYGNALQITFPTTEQSTSTCNEHSTIRGTFLVSGTSDVRSEASKNSAFDVWKRYRSQSCRVARCSWRSVYFTVLGWDVSSSFITFVCIVIACSQLFKRIPSGMIIKEMLKSTNFDFV